MTGYSSLCHCVTTVHETTVASLIIGFNYFALADFKNVSLIIIDNVVDGIVMMV